MDPISDMLISIKNALAVKHPTVDVPFSNFKYKIAKILEKEGFVGGVEKKGRKAKKIIKIILRYEDKNPVVSDLRRVSKQGQRVYVSNEETKRVKGRGGIAIISTSKGLMTDKEARKQKLGGEVICEIW